MLQVFFPAFSQMREPEPIAGAWLRATRMVALVVVPAMLGVIAVAPEFVAAVFGEKWHAAVTVIQILAPVGLLQTLTTLNAGVLQSLDLTRRLFRFTLVLSIATVGAFAAGLPWGIDGVATAYLIVTVALQPMFVRLTAHAVGLTSWDWLRSIAGVLQAGAAMLVAVLVSRELLLRTHLPDGRPTHRARWHRRAGLRAPGRLAGPGGPHRATGIARPSGPRAGLCCCRTDRAPSLTVGSPI